MNDDVYILLYALPRYRTIQIFGPLPVRQRNFELRRNGTTKTVRRMHGMPQETATAEFATDFFPLKNISLQQLSGVPLKKHKFATTDFPCSFFHRP
jgi:hypothetical protein